MPKNVRGEWISRECARNEHTKCLHEFDDGSGKPAFCDCDCHRKKKGSESRETSKTEEGYNLGFSDALSDGPCRPNSMAYVHGYEHGLKANKIGQKLSH